MNNPTTTFSAQRMKSVVYIWCPRCPNGSVKIHHNGIGACSDCGLEYQATVQITALPAPVEIPTEEARARETTAILVARIDNLNARVWELENAPAPIDSTLAVRVTELEHQMKALEILQSGAAIAQRLGEYMRTVSVR